MSISAQRLRFLDKETNIPVKDFTSLVDNAVYNEGEVSPAISLIKKDESNLNLKTLQGSLNKLDDIIKAGKNDSKVLTTAVLTKLKKSNLPDISNDILDSVIGLDESKTKTFFQDTLKIGGMLLCNSSEFLKTFFTGYNLNKKLGEGLLFALLFAMLSRYCKELSKKELAKSGKKDVLYSMFPYKGKKLTNGNSLKLFKGYYSDSLKSKVPLSLQSGLVHGSFITQVKDANKKFKDVRKIVAKLNEYELGNTEKDALKDSIETDLALTIPGSIENQNLLFAKGEISKLSTVSFERRSNAIKYEHTNDKLGSMMAGITDIDLESPSFFNKTGTDATMLTALKAFKKTAEDTNTAKIRSTKTGSFMDIDFASILPILDPATTAELLASKVETDSHRLYEISPTAEVFL